MRYNRLYQLFNRELVDKELGFTTSFNQFEAVRDLVKEAYDLGWQAATEEIVRRITGADEVKMS